MGHASGRSRDPGCTCIAAGKAAAPMAQAAAGVAIQSSGRKLVAVVPWCPKFYDSQHPIRVRGDLFFLGLVLRYDLLHIVDKRLIQSGENL